MLAVVLAKAPSPHEKPSHPREIALDWSAPRGCPDEAQLRERIEALISYEPDGDGVTEVVGRVWTDADGVVGFERLLMGENETPVAGQREAPTRRRSVAAPEPPAEPRHSFERPPAPEPERDDDRRPTPRRRGATLAQSSDHSPLRDETVLLRQASHALDEAQYERALSLVSQAQKEYGNPVLADLRLALRIDGLCSSNKSIQGRAEARQFFARFPNSPLGKRVHQACSLQATGAAETDSARPRPGDR